MKLLIGFAVLVWFGCLIIVRLLDLMTSEVCVVKGIYTICHTERAPPENVLIAATVLAAAVLSGIAWRLGQERR